MATEQRHHPGLDKFPVSPVFIMLLMLPPDKIFLRKITVLFPLKINNHLPVYHFII